MSVPAYCTVPPETWSNGEHCEHALGSLGSILHSRRTAHACRAFLDRKMPTNKDMPESHHCASDNEWTASIEKAVKRTP